MTALKYGLMLGGVFDMGLCVLANFKVDALAKLCPFWISSDEKYTRMVGFFMFLCGVARLHGGLNINEKGAYRVALWSFIVEIAFHAGEVYRGTMTLKDTMPVYVICSTGILFMMANYRRMLYAESDNKQGKKK